MDLIREVIGGVVAIRVGFASVDEVMPWRKEHVSFEETITGARLAVVR